MTLAQFVSKNALRNKRRSSLTVLSIAFSIVLLTLMMALWRSFYAENLSEESPLRLLVRHRVSLAFDLPAYYREKIRTVPGVVAVVPLTWFGGIYIDDKPEHTFGQLGTDPEEFFQVYRDEFMDADQIAAWQHDRQGVIVDTTLAERFGWKLGDRIVLKGAIYPVDLELNIRGIFHTTPDDLSVYFNSKYLEEGVRLASGRAGMFGILADSPAHVSRVAHAVDDLFHNAPQPTRTETERAFMLDFVAMMGNVKAFIVGICSAVIFTTLLVSANTMAMSIRERTREVSVLKTLGFTQPVLLGLFVGEAVMLSIAGGIVGSLAAFGLLAWFARSPQLTQFLVLLPTSPLILAVAIAVAAVVGFLSAVFPSYRASKMEIVEGLRYIG
jgi:putative ABC transport system permease protein